MRVCVCGGGGLKHVLRTNLSYTIQQLGSKDSILQGIIRGATQSVLVICFSIVGYYFQSLHLLCIRCNGKCFFRCSSIPDERHYLVMWSRPRN